MSKRLRATRDRLFERLERNRRIVRGLPPTDKPQLARRVDRATVVDTICDVMIEGWRSSTIEDLLVRPGEAIRFANAVNRQLCRPCNDPNTEDVLRTALNARKQGDRRFKRRTPRRKK